MFRGCLFILALWLGGYFVEDFYLRAHGIQYEWWVPLLLSLGITLSVSNLSGILQAVKQKRIAAIPPSDWRDGQIIGVGGKVQPIRQALVSPLTQKLVVAYEYTVRQVSGSGKNRTSIAVCRGLAMAPCTVFTSRGALRIVGFPMMTNFPAVLSPIRPYVSQLSTFFAKTRFREEPRSWKKTYRRLQEILKDEDGDLKFDAVDEKCPFEVRREKDASSNLPPSSSLLSAARPDTEEEAKLNEEYYRSTFAAFSGEVNERIIPAGADVTIFGTYRTSPVRIDIGEALSKLNHGLFLGEISRVLNRRLFSAIIFTMIFGALTVVGHLAAYHLL